MKLTLFSQMCRLTIGVFGLIGAVWFMFSEKEIAAAIFLASISVLHLYAFFRDLGTYE